MSIQLKQAHTFLHTSDLIQRPELIEKAAILKGLMIKKDREDRQYSETEAIGTYRLDKKLLEALEKVGFTFESGNKTPHNSMIYLKGNSNQRG